MHEIIVAITLFAVAIVIAITILKGIKLSNEFELQKAREADDRKYARASCQS
jgi:hypothetical protein